MKRQRDSTSQGSAKMADPDLRKRFPLLRPGWDYRLRHYMEDGCVTSISTGPVHTLRETSMMGLMNAITDKTDWQRKVHDNDIVANWKEEVLRSRANLENGHIDAGVFDWCIEELRDKAKFFNEHNFVPIFDTEYNAAKSDTLVPETLRQELNAQCQRLMNVSHAARDYHPGSNEQVLNLVHPSLYPLMYGKSRIFTPGPVPLKDCSAYIGKGEILPPQEPVPPFPYPPDSGGGLFNNGTPWLWSTKYQWLPCEVKFNEDKTTKIDSYINNLHPEGNEALYAVLAKFVDAAIPMWNACLPLSSGCFNKDCDGEPRITSDASRVWDPPSSYDLPPSPPAETDAAEISSNVQPDDLAGLLALANAQVQSPAPNAATADPKPSGASSSDSIDLESSSDEEEEEEEEEPEGPETRWHRIRRFVQPEPKPYSEWSAPWPTTHDLRNSCDEEGLQVIFKLASIELTPSNPTYPGGSWHVEGQFNERIAATAIYYYSCDNITPSNLSFRSTFPDIGMDLQYEQDDHEGIRRLFGVDGREGDCVSELGSVVTKQERMLCFPNNYQHRVSSMQLEDPSRPGHRRFLVMWLVDPWNKILSTANVPPQQKDWWVRELIKAESLPLPAELTVLAGNEVRGDFPVSEEEARMVRLDLMKDRTYFQEASEAHIEQFNLCEH